MNNKTADINQLITINAPIKTVWDAITDPTQLSLWFGQSAEFELTPGSVGWFGWSDHGKFAMQIEAVSEPTYFAWRWMAAKEVAFNKAESTLVEWHLKSITSAKTEISLRESGFLKPQSRADNVQGWNQELEHLEQYLNAD